MPESPRTFAEWMRSGEALNMPGGMRPPRDDVAPGAAAGFSLPPDDGEANDRAFFHKSVCRKEGVDDRRLQGIARGKTPTEGEIDLHGWTAEEAHARLEDFLRDALAQGMRVVEVVHGRGLRAEDGKGVLRAKTRKWLAQCDAVLGYIEPRKNSGAVRVLLRKNYGGGSGGGR